MFSITPQSYQAAVRSVHAIEYPAPPLVPLPDPPGRFHPWGNAIIGVNQGGSPTPKGTIG